MPSILKKTTLRFIFSMIILFSSSILCANKPPTLALHIKGQVFHLRIANTPELRAQGLSHIRALKPKEGMLFIFDKEGIQDFWMKDCLIDLDILFLDSKGTIVKTYTMEKQAPRQKNESFFHYVLRLKRYSSIKPAQYAIELSKGQIKRLKIQLGHNIALLDALKKLS